jgi:pentatricopeptide repeat domain-containing protein 3
VKLANAFSLPICETVAQRVMTNFAINPEQKEALANLNALISDSDDGSSSVSDSDISESN